MWTLRRNQWVTLQSLLWLPLLALSAASPFLETLAPAREGSFRTGKNLGLVLLGLVSYVQLVRILGAGRTLADRVTLGRFGLILVGTTGLFVLRIERIELWLLLVSGVSLDLLDGWAARRFGGSEGGTVLDMETDQLTTLFLALLAHERVVASDAPPWVALAGAAFLVLPALKYVFALALRKAPRVNDPKPSGDRTRARRTCAIVLTGLLLCTAPVFTESLVVERTRLLAGLVLAVLLAASFAGDVRHVVAGKGSSNPG